MKKTTTKKPIKKIRQYYLVTYVLGNSDTTCFGNIFYCAEPALNIRQAEKEIAQRLNYKKPVIILVINKITKWQYNQSNKV